MHGGRLPTNLFTYYLLLLLKQEINFYYFQDITQYFDRIFVTVVAYPYINHNAYGVS